VDCLVVTIKRHKRPRDFKCQSGEQTVTLRGNQSRKRIAILSFRGVDRRLGYVHPYITRFYLGGALDQRTCKRRLLPGHIVEGYRRRKSISGRRTLKRALYFALGVFTPAQCEQRNCQTSASLCIIRLYRELFSVVPDGPLIVARTSRQVSEV